MMAESRSTDTAPPPGGPPTIDISDDVKKRFWSQLAYHKKYGSDGGEDGHPTAVATIKGKEFEVYALRWEAFSANDVLDGNSLIWCDELQDEIVLNFEDIKTITKRPPPSGSILLLLIVLEIFRWCVI